MTLVSLSTSSARAEQVAERTERGVVDPGAGQAEPRQVGHAGRGDAGPDRERPRQPILEHFQVPQLAQLGQAGVGDEGIFEVELPELGQRGEVRQRGVADGRVAEIEAAQAGERADPIGVLIVDVAVRGGQPGEPRELDEPGAGDVRPVHSELDE